MVNKVILIGNVGQDPEIRHTKSGNKSATFSIATSDFWKDRETGERRSNTHWHRIVVFNENLANFVENYIKKGSKIYVEGALQSRKYTGSDGIERNITEVVLSQYKGEIQFVESRSSDSNFSGQKEQSNYAATETKAEKTNTTSSSSVGDDLDDEIPF